MYQYLNPLVIMWLYPRIFLLHNQHKFDPLIVFSSIRTPLLDKFVTLSAPLKTFMALLLKETGSLYCSRRRDMMLDFNPVASSNDFIPSRTSWDGKTLVEVQPTHSADLIQEVPSRRTIETSSVLFMFHMMISFAVVSIVIAFERS